MTSAEVKFGFDVDAAERNRSHRERMGRVPIGSRVRVTVAANQVDEEFVGQVGTLERVDPDDSIGTLRVLMSDGRARWVYDVEPENAAREVPDPALAALRRQLENAQTRASSLASQLEELRQAVSDKAYELKDANGWCQDVEDWLRENGCPIRLTSGSARLTVTLNVSFADVERAPDDTDTDWLVGQLADAGLDIGSGSELSLDDYTVESSYIDLD